jgi:hypothetical protein
MDFTKGDITKKYELIERLLKPSEYQKKTNGEVFTPLSLVNDMLDKLPDHVWYNPNFRWLDPAVGVGNFPLVVYNKLMESLTMIPIESRSKHILENMLFSCDICPINGSIYESILGKTNFDCVSFFDYTETDFDVIIGNPPYNDKCVNGKAIGWSNTLWDKFVKESLKKLKKDGYLCFVHPSGWRKPEATKSKTAGLFESMIKDNQMLYLEIHDTKDGLKTFNAGTRYDFYVIQNKKCYTTTIVKDQEGNVSEQDLKNWKWLPNSNFPEISDLLGGGLDVYKNSIYFSTKMSKSETEDFKFPLIHSTNKSGIRYLYSDVNTKGHFGVSKVIFGDSGINDVIIDLDGNYGATEHAISIMVSSRKEAEDLKMALLSDKFKKILKACSWSNFQIDYRMFLSFKKDFYKNFI